MTTVPEISDPMVFTVDAQRIRRGVLIAGAVGAPLVAIIAFELYDRLPARLALRPWLVFALVAAYSLLIVLVMVRTRAIVFTVDGAGMSLDYRGRVTRVPWDATTSVQLMGRDDERSTVLVTPTTQLRLPGRWRVSRLARGAVPIMPAGAGWPRWSPSYRDRVEVVNIGWFPPADRGRIVAALRHFMP